MIHADNTKTVVSLLETGVVTNATTNTTIDTQGYEYADIVVAVEPADATNSDYKLTSLVFYDAPTTDVSNQTAIDGLTGTTNSTATSSQFVLPTNNDTSTPQTIRALIDLTDKERYIHVTLQGSSTAMNTVAVMANLSRAKEAPTTAANKGVDTLARPA